MENKKSPPPNRENECQCCGRIINDLRLGYCWDCAEMESVIAYGTDMYDKKIANTSMEKLKYIISVVRKMI